MFKRLLLIISLTLSIHATNNKTEPVNFSLVISGGVSLGAYESGYNWALIKMLKQIKKEKKLLNPSLKSVAGASAGSINALLSAMYWCQKETIPLHNSVTDNLFYETWVHLGIEDLMIEGSDPQNKSSLLTRRGLEKKGVKIIAHMQRPIFKNACEVPLGVAVTKVRPIVEEVQGIKVKNQNFSVPLNLKIDKEKAVVYNKPLHSEDAFYISIPGIEQNRSKLIDVLFASGAFPGAFQQVKLDYAYKGIKHSNYFIDGGLYDNVPLDLAIALNHHSDTFFFMDPSNMRKEAHIDDIDSPEEMPMGFISTNLLPVLSSFDIMQSMKLYQAINKHFKKGSKKKLILSSRFHPLTGKYLGHFGAFLDINFRKYDYHVGVYDAIFHLAKALKYRYPEKYTNHSQTELMETLKNMLGVDKDPEALAAYRLFKQTEFTHEKPQTKDKFSAIYNAFNTQKQDASRYADDEFQTFLKKLDMRYLQKTDDGFLVHAKKDIDNWYKRPMRSITNRVNSIENDYAKVDPDHASVATLTSLSAWIASSSVKQKEGFVFLPLDVPQDEGKASLRTALRLLPGEVAADVANGGMSLGYTALYYSDLDFIDGFEAKASYVVADKTSNFVRVDMSAFKEFDDRMKFGLGASVFGDMEGSFYKRESAYGVNTYVDFLDIFRFTYVYREGDLVDNNYFYFGIENIPSLIYWLNR